MLILRFFFSISFHCIWFQCLKIYYKNVVDYRRFPKSEYNSWKERIYVIRSFSILDFESWVRITTISDLHRQIVKSFLQIVKSVSIPLVTPRRKWPTSAAVPSTISPHVASHVSPFSSPLPPFFLSSPLPCGLNRCGRSVDTSLSRVNSDIRLPAAVPLLLPPRWIPRVCCAEQPKQMTVEKRTARRCADGCDGNEPSKFRLKRRIYLLKEDDK